MNKVAICIISKGMNQYLIEWVEHYKSLGFDKIIFYDNDFDDEIINNKGQYNVIKSYIDEGFIIYYNWKNKKSSTLQRDAYKDYMQKHKNDFDYTLFTDSDAFLDVKKYGNIKNFLLKNSKKFEKFEGIAISIVTYGDNGLVHNDGRPLKERFKISLKSKRNNETFNTIVNHHKCRNKVGSVHHPFSSKLCDIYMGGK